MSLRQGTLIFDNSKNLYDIRFDIKSFYGGLCRGQCFDVLINGKWKPTKIEFGVRWYLVGIPTCDLVGLRVRIP